MVYARDTNVSVIRTRNEIERTFFRIFSPANRAVSSDASSAVDRSPIVRRRVFWTTPRTQAEQQHHDRQQGARQPEQSRE